jgi:ketosteroid isomerase-like protein
VELQENKTLVRRIVDEAQVQGKLDVIDDIFADDFVDHTPLPGLPPTREGIRILFGLLRGAFPDLRVVISEQIAEDDRVVTRKTFHGTHGGEFLGFAPTGNPVSFEVVDILTIRGKRITEHRVVFDQLGLLRQLGAPV